MVNKNLTRQVSVNQLITIINDYETKTNVHLMKIDGSKVKDEDSYSKLLKGNLQTAVDIDPLLNWNHYNDIMTDPYTYYNKDEIVIFIMNYNDFLTQDTELKVFVEQKFKEMILPFFEEEIERVFVGGVKTKYSIYYSL